MEIGSKNAILQFKKILLERFGSIYETQIIFSLVISNLIFNKVALPNVANAETFTIAFSFLFFFFFIFIFLLFSFAATSFPLVRRANHLVIDFHLSVITREKGEGSVNVKKKNYYFQNNYKWCLEFIQNTYGNTVLKSHMYYILNKL